MNMMASTSLANWNHTAHRSWANARTPGRPFLFRLYRVQCKHSCEEVWRSRAAGWCRWSCWYWNMCPHHSRPIYHHWKNVSILRWDGIWRRFEVCNWRPRVLDYEAGKFATQNTKKPKSIQSSQFVGCGSQSHFNTRNFEMRQKICRGNAFVCCEGPVQTIGCTPRKGRRW